MRFNQDRVHPSIKFPEAHTFVLKYRVIGGLEVDNSQTKFKWIAIFPDHNVPIKAAKVTLHLPAKLSKYTKDFTTSSVIITRKLIDPTTIQFVVKDSIKTQSELAISGQFPTNLLVLDKSQWKSTPSEPLYWLLTILFLIFCFVSSCSGGGGSSRSSRISRSYERNYDYDDVP